MKLNKVILFFCMYTLFSCTNNSDNKFIPDKKNNKGNHSLLNLNLETSDSVFLISHDPTFKVARDTPLGYDSVQLIVNGNLNKEIIKESIKIKNHIELVKILESKLTDSIITLNNCFIPHHAILVYFKNKIDYLDICFLCKTTETPKNSVFSKIIMENKTFDILESFFKENGIKYFPKLEE